MDGLPDVDGGPPVIGRAVRIIAPGSGYHNIHGTVVEDYRNPGEPDHLDAVLVKYGPGRDVMVGADQVEEVN